MRDKYQVCLCALPFRHLQMLTLGERAHGPSSCDVCCTHSLPFVAERGATQPLRMGGRCNTKRSIHTMDVPCCCCCCAEQQYHTRRTEVNSSNSIHTRKDASTAQHSTALGFSPDTLRTSSAAFASQAGVLSHTSN